MVKNIISVGQKKHLYLAYFQSYISKWESYKNEENYDSEFNYINTFISPYSSDQVLRKELIKLYEINWGKSNIHLVEKYLENNTICKSSNEILTSIICN